MRWGARLAAFSVLAALAGQANAASTSPSAPTSDTLKPTEGIGLEATTNVYGGGDAIGTTWIYNSTSGGGPLYNYPQGLNNFGNGGATLTTTPASMPDNLTAGGLSLTSSYSTTPSGSNTAQTGLTAEADVSASLLTGEIHSYGYGTDTLLSEGDAATTGALSDEITWNFTGQVHVNLGVDGTVVSNCPPLTSYCPSSSFTNQLYLYLGGNTVSYQGDNGSNTTCGDQGGSGDGECYHGASANWSSVKFSDLTMTSFAFSGDLDVSKGEYMPIYFQYALDPCGYNFTCDFSHTAQISFTGLAAGDFTSNSGVFLSAAAPEPGTWVLMAAGAAPSSSFASPRKGDGRARRLTTRGQRGRLTLAGFAPVAIGRPSPHSAAGGLETGFGRRRRPQSAEPEQAAHHVAG